MFIYKQVSGAEKDAVPEHVKEAARQMGQKAYKERLKEIEMTEYDDKVYNEYSLPVKHQVKKIFVIFIESILLKLINLLFRSRR